MGTEVGPAALSFTPDGRHLFALRLFYNELIAYDATTLEPVKSIKGRDAPASGAAFGAISFAINGRTVAVSGLDDQLTVWDTTDWREIQRFPDARGITGAVIFPDGKQVVTAGPDNFARLWDIESGIEVGRFAGHSAPVIGLALSPDAKRLATGGADRTVRIWNVATRELVATLEGHIAPVLSVAFSPDGSTVASTAAGVDVLLWQMSEGRPTATRLLDPKAEAEASGGTQALAQFLLLLSSARTYQLTGAPGPGLLATGPGVTPAFNCPLAYSPDGRHLAIIHHLELFSGGYHAEVYEVATGRRVSRRSGAFGALAFSPDGNTLATKGVINLILVDPISGIERRQ